MKKLFILVLTVVILFAGFVVYVNKDSIFDVPPTIENCEHEFVDGKCTECGMLEDTPAKPGDDDDNGNDTGNDTDDDNNNDNVVQDVEGISLDKQTISF